MLVFPCHTRSLPLDPVQTRAQFPHGGGHSPPRGRCRKAVDDLTTMLEGTTNIQGCGMSTGRLVFLYLYPTRYGGISRPAFRTWVARYEADGEDGLRD